MGRYRNGAGRIALVGLLTALSLLFLYLSSVSPAARLGIVAIAGLVPAAAVVSAGIPAGFFCYAATGLLGLLVSPDKGNTLLYLFFFGLYPMAKALIERTRKLPLEWLLKVILFNAVLTLLWFVLQNALLSALPDYFDQIWLVYLVGNLAFVIYDLGFSKLIAFYVARVDKAVRKR